MSRNRGRKETQERLKKADAAPSGEAHQARVVGGSLEQPLRQHKEMDPRSSCPWEQRFSPSGDRSSTVAWCHTHPDLSALSTLAKPLVSWSLALGQAPGLDLGLNGTPELGSQ